MATILSFSSLVEAISRSVAQAQDQVEKHQLQNLLAYFDKNHRPLDLEFKVPSRRADALPGEEDAYSVPLLSLVPVNVLKIKEVEIKFSVELGDVAEEPGTEPEPGSIISKLLKQKSGEKSEIDEVDFGRPMKALNVSTVTGKKGGKVQVALRVEGGDPPEGAARLLDYLAQMQGVTIPINESGTDVEEDEEQSPDTQE